jgi:hypothetical protein
MGSVFDLSNVEISLYFYRHYQCFKSGVYIENGLLVILTWLKCINKTVSHLKGKKHF